MITVAARANGLERSHVVDMQRARLLTAAGQVACESGLPNVTVAHIVSRAGVSRRTFYEIFTDSEDCVTCALTAALEQAQARVLPVWRSQGSWAERVRRSLVELLCLFDEEPVAAQLLLVESLAGGREVLERRARTIEGLVDALNEGRREVQGVEPQTARLGAEGAVGGVLSILHSRVSQGATGALVDLASVLVSMLALPVQGPAAARRELTRPVSAPNDAARGPEEGTPLHVDPFKAAGMRLTYRTMRVLSAIGEHPGLSNRKISSLAGMSDQGQVSKLLARLERAELIFNESQSHGKGDPNAWTLSAAGRHVANRIGAHVEGQTA